MKIFSLDRKDLQREFLEKKVQTFHLNLSEQARTLPDSLYSALHTLQKIRMGFSEDLNQLFHVAAITSAYNELIEMKSSHAKLEWEWNPTQQGTGNEPSLRGIKNNKTVICAEVRTIHDISDSTGHTIRYACRKLNRLGGSKFLFVANDRVETFAKAFVKQEKLKIKVVSLKIRRVRVEEQGRLHREI